MSEVLREFAETFRKCWLCGATYRLEIHHLVRGVFRKKAREEECCLIRTCSDCHRDKLDGMAIPRQLALVKVNNPAAYDRTKVCALRGRADEAVTEAEVDAYTEGWNP